MQGDIIDTICNSRSEKCHVIDPFVGSGTVMNEALLRGIDFTGVDINPLAVLVCEAKAAVDTGLDIGSAIEDVLALIKSDNRKAIDVDFAGRQKWFDDPSAVKFSVLRRAIMTLADAEVRKILWTVFAETIRLCSNSRTSTYKLHIRPPEDRVPAEKVLNVFETNLKGTQEKIKEYQMLMSGRGDHRPHAKLFCSDIRKASFELSKNAHQVVVTSPPYGDNQTTIPYGQFSYLAMNWIPKDDLPEGLTSQLLDSTHALDTASLGGSLRGADAKECEIRSKSESFDRFLEQAQGADQQQAVRKVSCFMADFAEALCRIREMQSATAHWVLTTGNRTVSGMTVPFDAICKELAIGLGGKPVETLYRNLPSKRMPSRNSQGAMITTETTTVLEFE